MLKMSQMITSTQELRELGINVLKIPENIVQTAIYDHRHSSIHDASHQVLSTWQKQYQTEQEAYESLYRGLKNCQMNHLAAELKRLASASELTTQEWRYSKTG